MFSATLFRLFYVLLLGLVLYFFSSAFNDLYVFWSSEFVANVREALARE